MTTVSLIGAFIGLASVFVGARLLARYAVFYRRNNLSVIIALSLSGVAIYMWGWLGLWAFIAGTVIGAWAWISDIEAANQQLHPTETPSRSESRASGTT
jgi:hypothetical protein